MIFTKFLRWTVIISLIATIFTPFIVSQSLYFPFIVGKAIFFRVFVEIAFAAWVLLALRDASARPKFSPLMWSFIAFTAVVGVADVFGMNLWKSFWSNFERMEGYITILHLLAYFVVAGSVLASEKLWKLFLQVSVGASVIVSYYGLLQFFGQASVNQGGVRLDSFLGNATYLAAYLLFNVFFALILMAREKGWLMRSIYGAVIVLNMIVMYNTGTRGSVLGLIGGGLVAALLIAIFEKSDRRRRAVAASFVGVIVVVVGGFLLVKNSDFVQKSPVLSRFASISLYEVKTQARAYIWPMAIEGFKEKPILGWGQENFNYIFNANYDPRMYGQEQWFDRAHNVLLDWLVASGILGLMAYLSLWVSALYLLWRKVSDTSFSEKAILTGLGVAYFINNIFVFDNTVTYMLFVSVLAFIHFKSTRLVHPTGSNVEEIDDADMNMVAGLVLVCLCLCMYFINIRVYASGSALIDALRASQGNPVNAEAVISTFKKALSYDTVGRSEIVERLIEAVPRINTENVSIESRQKYYTLANDAIERQLKNLPGDARYELFSGSFYVLYGMNDLALQHILEAEKLSPTKQTILYALGSLYTSNKKYAEGIEVFKRAYELEKSNSTALEYYAVALATAGRDSEAAALLKEKTGSSDMTGDSFLQIYVNRGEWSKVVSALISRIKASPKDMSLRTNLAAAYLQLGNKTAAVKTIKEMIAIDPSFKDTGEEYIRQIEIFKP